MLRTLAAIARHVRPGTSGKRDRALVLVPGGATADAYLIDHVRDAHHVTVYSHVPDVPWSELAPLHPAVVPYLPPVVIATAPLDAVTLATSITLERPRPETRVHAGEFQEALKKLQVSLWAEHRARIAEKLGVDPIDAVLVSFRVESVRVEGSEVLNPHELVGGRVDIDVTVRFVSRDTFERAREAAPAPFFSDPAWALVAGHDAVAPAVLIAQGAPAVLVTAPDERARMREVTRMPLQWSPADITRELEVRWALSRAAADDVLAGYLAGSATGDVARVIEGIVGEPRKSLDRELGNLKVRDSVATITSASIPPSSGRGAIELVRVKPHNTLRSTGLELVGTEADALVLAAFSEFYYSERYSKLNAWLRQRIAWLGTAGAL